MAFALGHYLDAQARYEGFDISAKFVASARERFKPLPNFHFRHADIFNRMYNRRERSGRGLPFPLRGRLVRIRIRHLGLHHMLRGDVRNYLREIRRVLRRAAAASRRSSRSTPRRGPESRQGARRSHSATGFRTDAW